jgi:predicted RecB family nuclease
VQLVDGAVILSSQDLVGAYQCEHKVNLDFARQHGLIERPKLDDAAAEILQRQGLEHEQRLLNGLESELRVKKLGNPAPSLTAYEVAWQATKQAMLDEYDVIYQGTLFTGDFVGFVDFLVALKDENGELVRENDLVVYEPVDAKSSRSAKSNAVLQVAAYCETLVRLGCPTPRQAHLWLAQENKWSESALRLIPLATEFRTRALELVSQSVQLPVPIWEAPRSACVTCAWLPVCEQGRKADRDLSLIQGIRSVTREKLVANGISTIDQMAEKEPEDRPIAIAESTFTKLAAQAKLQVQGEAQNEIITQIINAEVLANLPPRNEGDIWFDMEGDPYAYAGEGLEYMFGYSVLVESDGPKQKLVFDTCDADSRQEEKVAFEAFIDSITRRISQFPGLHIYHYADYERRTLLALANRHATRESEIDQLLRDGRLIDLYSVVRQAFMFSTDSLSLKAIEHIYRGDREKDGVTNAMDSVIQYERFMALKELGEDVEAAKVRQDIRNYNEDDCESTFELDQWMRTVIDENEIQSTYQPAVAPEDGPDHLAIEVERSLRKLVPVDKADRTPEQQAISDLASCIQYHWRESKPAWWRIFDLAKASIEELSASPHATVVVDGTSDGWDKTGRQRKLRREITLTCDSAEAQDAFDKDADVHLIYSHAEPGMMALNDALSGITKATVNSAKGNTITLTEMEGPEETTWSSLPIAVVAGPPTPGKVIQDQLLSLAVGALARSEAGLPIFENNAWNDVLLRREPRFKTEGSSLAQENAAVASIVKSLSELDGSYVAVQGPPGTGKTFTGSAVVAELISQGWKIGVVAQSHSVVEQFMDKVKERNLMIPMAKKPQFDSTKSYHRDGIDGWAMGQPGGYLVGGTAWSFCSSKFKSLDLDLIVVDEAGQFSLANTLAVISTGKNALLLGDPQQLPQVSQGSHPDPVEVASLAHLLNGRATIPSTLGYFLSESYRMHSLVTEPVSKLQYDGELLSHPRTDARLLEATPPGLHSVEVNHSGNRTSSAEEANEVSRIISERIGRLWTEVPGAEGKPLDHSDFIVVAAYNAQVRMLKRVLRDAGLQDVQVGTVDKFQGREAAISIVSMATSSDEDLPRGIDFLLSPNRLNVAVSRAQWAAYLVHSPSLRRLTPTSVSGLVNLGGFLGLLD